jgi:PAS domain S-box-containing protein
MDIYESLFEFNNDGIAVIQDGICKLANPALLKILGSPDKSAILDKPVSDFLTPDSHQKLLQVQSSGDSGPSFFQAQIITENSELIDIQINFIRSEYRGSPADELVFRAAGSPAGFNPGQSENSDKYQVLLENASDILFELDSGGNVTYISPTVEKITGFKVKEIVGRHIGSFIHPEDLDGLQMGFEYDLKGEIEPGSFRHKTKKGEWIYLSITSHVRLREGKPDGITGIMTDVTRRKNAEAALKDNEVYFRTLMESSPDVIMALKEDGSIQYSTPSLFKVIGYPAEDIVGANFVKFVYPADSMPATRFFIDLSENPGSAEPVELRLKHRDGSNRDVELSGFNALDNPAVRSLILNIHDVTAGKQIQLREKQMEQELQVNSRLASIGQLAAGIAHEINNPLTSIIGFSKLLTRSELPDDVADKIKTINNEALRVAGIVRGLLTFARQDELHRSHVNINELLSQTLQLRSYEMATNNIQVTRDFAADLPSIQADPAQLQQVFLNLVLNAEKEMTAAHGKGNLTIKTEKKPSGIWISFKDDGPGISSENLPRIFNPFFTTRNIGEGTGLGLSICHGIVARHGGKITVQSKPGSGATFIVELPAEPADL